MQALFVSPSRDMLKEVASGMLSKGGFWGFWGWSSAGTRRGGFSIGPCALTWSHGRLVASSPWEERGRGLRGCRPPMRNTFRTARHLSRRTV